MFAQAVSPKPIPSLRQGIVLNKLCKVPKDQPDREGTGGVEFDFQFRLPDPHGRAAILRGAMETCGLAQPDRGAPSEDGTRIMFHWDRPGHVRPVEKERLACLFANSGVGVIRRWEYAVDPEVSEESCGPESQDYLPVAGVSSYFHLRPPMALPPPPPPDAMHPPVEPPISSPPQPPDIDMEQIRSEIKASILERLESEHPEKGAHRDWIKETLSPSSLTKGLFYVLAATVGYVFVRSLFEKDKEA